LRSYLFLFIPFYRGGTRPRGVPNTRKFKKGEKKECPLRDSSSWKALQEGKISKGGWIWGRSKIELVGGAHSPPLNFKNFCIGRKGEGGGGAGRLVNKRHRNVKKNSEEGSVGE